MSRDTGTREMAGVAAGTRDWYRLDGGERRPDPVSRFQPEGPHGPSEIVDPSAFRRTDGSWRGVPPQGQVLYEMHVGTFTPEGTWAAALAQLPALADLGITVIEPVAEFAGAFGWGYDGVDLYGPTRLYGRPDDLRAFVDRAHALNIGVILDVVYNHLGPDGNYLSEFATDYFTDRYKNAWGRAINFEGPPAARAFFVENAGYWVDEFHFDGLRLDATQDVNDASTEHVLCAIGRWARQAAGPRRAASTSSGRTSRSRPGWCAIRRPAATASTRCGTTTITPQRGGGADRTPRGLLHRLQRVDAGVHFLRQVRLSLPGAMVQVAEEAPRLSRARPAAARLRGVSREPRSGGELRVQTTPAPDLVAGALSQPDGADAAGPDHAAAVPGAGVRVRPAVPVFRRPSPGAARSDLHGPQGIPDPVSEHGRPRRAAHAEAVAFSSESVRYGGQGTAPLGEDDEWHLPGETAVLFPPVPRPADDDAHECIDAHH